MKIHFLSGVPCAWGGICISPFSMTTGVPPSYRWTALRVSLAPHHVSALPTLSDVASSLHLAAESLFCQPSGRFLGYLY